MHVIRGAEAKPQRATRDIFTGEVHSHTYVDDTIGEHLRLTLVRFSPGGRTKWHTPCLLPSLERPDRFLNALCSQVGFIARRFCRR